MSGWDWKFFKSKKNLVKQFKAWKSNGVFLKKCLLIKADWIKKRGFFEIKQNVTSLGTCSDRHEMSYLNFVEYNFWKVFLLEFSAKSPTGLRFLCLWAQ